MRKKSFLYAAITLALITPSCGGSGNSISTTTNDTSAANISEIPVTNQTISSSTEAPQQDNSNEFFNPNATPQTVEILVKVKEEYRKLANNQNKVFIKSLNEVSYKPCLLYDENNSYFICRKLISQKEEIIITYNFKLFNIAEVSPKQNKTEVSVSPNTTQQLIASHKLDKIQIANNSLLVVVNNPTELNNSPSFPSDSNSSSSGNEICFIDSM